MSTHRYSTKTDHQTKIILSIKKIGFFNNIVPVMNEKAAEASPLIHEQFFYIDLI